jgi:transcriptional regulator with GAF, ATPase, and Fis domain
MSEISNVLSKPARFEDSLSQSVGMLTSQPEIYDGLIAFVGETGEIRSMTKAGWRERVGSEESERLLSRAIRQVFNSGMPLILRNSPEYLIGAKASGPSAQKSLIGVPVKGDWAPIGAILVERQRLNDHSVNESLTEDISFLTVVASLVAQRMALKNVRTTGSPIANAGAKEIASEASSLHQHNHSKGTPTEGTLPRVRLVSRGKLPGASERHRIIDAMNQAGWVQAKAARILGVTVRQMRYALRKHSIEIKRF